MDHHGYSLALAQGIVERFNRAMGAPPEGAMRVGPGTDAVVWNICDTSHVEVEL